MATSSGRFTIEAVNNFSFTSNIITTQGYTQQYNPDNGAYAPDWSQAASANVLIPALYMVGNGNTNIIGNSNITTSWWDSSASPEVQLASDANYIVSNFLQTTIAGTPPVSNATQVTVASGTDLSVGMFIKVAPDTGIKRITGITGGTTINFTPGLTTATYAVGNVVSNAYPRALIIKANTLDIATVTKNAKTYSCNITYADSASGQNFGSRASTTLAVTRHGLGHVDALMFAANGTKFKNGTAPGGASSLTLRCDLWRNGVVDGVNASYEWFIFDTAQVTDAGNGVNWRKLDNSDLTKFNGATTNTLTVYPKGLINGVGNFTCKIKDIKVGSSTYNQYFYDVMRVIDASNTIQIVVKSTGGDKFVNSLGSTTLTAVLYRQGVEIDAAGSTYTYTWKKLDKNDNQVIFAGAGLTKTGKTLAVGSADVVDKCSFTVDIS